MVGLRLATMDVNRTASYAAAAASTVKSGGKPSLGLGALNGTLGLGSLNGTLAAVKAKLFDMSINFRGIVGANSQVIAGGLDGAKAYLERDAEWNVQNMANKTGVPVQGQVEAAFGAAKGARTSARKMVLDMQDAAKASLQSVVSHFG